MDRGSINRAFGWAMRVRRRDAELSLAQFWTQLGWTRSHYKRSEAGSRDIFLAELIEVAEALDIPPGVLLDDVLHRLRTDDYPQTSPGRELRRQLGM